MKQSKLQLKGPTGLYRGKVAVALCQFGVLLCVDSISMKSAHLTRSENGKIFATGFRSTSSRSRRMWRSGHDAGSRIDLRFVLRPDSVHLGPRLPRLKLDEGLLMGAQKSSRTNEWLYCLGC